MKPDEIWLLFDYQFWANTRILEQAAKLTTEELTTSRPVPHGSVRGGLVHMLNTDRGWAAFFAGTDWAEPYPEDAFPDFQTIAERWRETESFIKQYLSTLDEQTVMAKRSLAPHFSADVPLWALLVHLGNHGTQHRSEIAITLTELGHSPGNLDMVFFLGERFGSEADS